MAKADPIKRSLERWQQAQDARLRWTREALLDLRFAAGKTWNVLELEKFDLEGREAPNYNLIMPVVNLVCGVEAQSRQDIKYLPRTDKNTDGADAATKIAMLVRDQNQGDRQLSRQFRDAVTTGVGWMEAAYNPDPMAFDLMRRRINPFHMYADPCGKEPDMSDWIDVFRSVVCYPEQLALRFPQHRRQIMAAQSVALANDLSHSADYTNTNGDYPDVWMFEQMNLNGAYDESGDKPKQIRAVERWYKVEEWGRFVKLRDGRVFEPAAIEDAATLQMLAKLLVERDGNGKPLARMVTALTKRIRVALFLPYDGGVLLNDAPSPYQHNRFPFVPMWAYEDDRGVPMGMVRSQRTPQRDFNARMAHLLKRSLTNQVHYEEGAFVDEDEALTEMTKSHGTIKYAPGALQSGKVRVENNLQAAPLEQSIMQMDQAMIQDYSGVTAELLGQETNAKSGTAIQARQSQGQTRLFTLFDNRNWTHEEISRLELANIQATFTDEMVVRVTDSARGMSFVTVNQRQPDGSVANDITNAIFDVKATMTKQHDTALLGILETISTLAGQMPPQMQMVFAPTIAKIAASATAIPDAAELLGQLDAIKNAMLQQMTGPPPGAAQPSPSPQLGDQAAMLQAQVTAAKAGITA